MKPNILDEYEYDPSHLGVYTVFDPRPAETGRHGRFYYHVTNQTDAGDSTEFPVSTDVVIKDLRVIQWYADGSCREAPLLDADGNCATALDTRMVFLESADNPPPHPFPVEAVSISGKIEPSLIEVQGSPSGAVRVVRVRDEFLIDIVDPVAGTYLTLTVSDREGNRYPIGTFGILEVD